MPFTACQHKHSTKTTKTHTTKTIHNKHTPPPATNTTNQPKSALVPAPVSRGQHVRSSWDARVHYQDVKHQENTNPPRAIPLLRPDPSGPNSVPNQKPDAQPARSTPTRTKAQRGSTKDKPHAGQQRSSMIPLVNTTNAHHTATPTSAGAR